MAGVRRRRNPRWADKIARRQKSKKPQIPLGLFLRYTGSTAASLTGIRVVQGAGHVGTLLIIISEGWL